MADVNTALAASKQAIEQLIATGERCGPACTAPRAAGKWSPTKAMNPAYGPATADEGPRRLETAGK